jgi:hypothetical protein
MNTLCCLLVSLATQAASAPSSADSAATVKQATRLVAAIGQAPSERAPDAGQEKSMQRNVAVKSPDRLRARIYVVASHYDRLPNFAEVMVFATNGKCIRRGSPRGTGEGFDADRGEPLDARYRRLWVVAAGSQGGRPVTGSMLIIFDQNNWRPVTRYDSFAADPNRQSGQWRADPEYDPATGKFPPIVDSAWTLAQIRVMIPAEPVPVWNPAAPTRAATVAACNCGPALPQDRSGSILERLGIHPEPLSTPALEQLAARDAAIVEAGRPLSPDHEWAEFGRRWVRGGSGTYWQTPLGGQRP